MRKKETMNVQVKGVGGTIKGKNNKKKKKKRMKREMKKKKKMKLEDDEIEGKES